MVIGHTLMFPIANIILWQVIKSQNLAYSIDNNLTQGNAQTLLIWHGIFSCISYILTDWNTILLVTEYLNLAIHLKKEP